MDGRGCTAALPCSPSPAGARCDYLLEYLQQKKKAKDLHYFYRLDGDRLEMVFWEVDGGLKDWARGGELNVLLFDPTWGTNRYGMKLACFTTVAPTGRTIINACVIIRNENAATFEWCFRCFSEVFVTAPNVVFTDHDSAIEIAFETLSAFECDPWHGTTHCLCVFHISKNFSRHLKPLFANNAEWHRANGLFWRIAKESDEQSIARWDEEWHELIHHVEEHSRPEASADTGRKDRKANALEWLRSLDGNREKWAARFVFSRCTFGIHSTQRAESTNAALKGYFVRARMLMTEVIQNVDEYNKTSRDRHAVEAHLLKLRNGRSLGATSSAAVRSLEEKLTPYAMSLVLEQEASILQYKVIASPDEDEDKDLPEPSDDYAGYVYVQRQIAAKPIGPPCQFNNSNEPHNFDCPTDFGLADAPYGGTPLKYRIATVTHCSCQFPMAFGGLPCRHILAACLHDGLTEYPTESIASKWLLLDAHEEHRLEEKLLRAASQRSDAPPLAAHASGSSTSTLSRAERYRMILSDARNVADKACESAETFHETMTVLKELRTRLRLGLSVGGAWASANDGKRQNDESTTDGQGVPEPEASEGTAYYQDMKDWDAAMGIARKAVPTLPDNFVAAEDALFKTVMVKYYPKRQGGWYAGTVQSWDSHAGLFEVKFEADNKTERLRLETNMYSSQPSSKIWSWVLLESRSLSDECDPSQVQPPAGGVRGRPRETRYAPPPGHPTSHGWHQQKGLSPMKKKAGSRK